MIHKQKEDPPGE